MQTLRRKPNPVKFVSCTKGTPLHPWEWPEQPWFRVHADYAGPFKGKMFFLLVDAHAKWLEVHIMDSSTSAATIEKMKLSFACHGFPVLLVMDNGSNFTSQEFETFLKRHGVRHVRTAPYHPASNGQVERAVQTFKTAMKKSGGKGGGNQVVQLYVPVQDNPTFFNHLQNC